MKGIFIIIGVLIFQSTFSQLQPGRDNNEIRDMIRLNTSYTFLNLYGDDKDIIPTDYKRIYTSEEIGMDNMYQIYLKGKIAVFNFRGSTDKSISWQGNITSSMIPAKGNIYIDGVKNYYCVSKDNGANVHAGYMLATALLSSDILKQMKNLNEKGITNFIFTGHSQGGALSNMITAYLHYLPEGKFKVKNTIKTYAFAAPKIGNRVFVEDYNATFCSINMSFNIMNPEDPANNMPLSYNDSTSFVSGLANALFSPNVSMSKVVFDGVVNRLESHIESYMESVSNSALNQISKKVGTIVLPEYTTDINFYPIGNRIEILPAEYPLALRDSTILQNDSLMAVLKRDENGKFLHPTLYKMEPLLFQHKPYNYYVTILKMYFPEEYKKLKVKYLPENI